VNISSAVGIVGYPGTSCYDASKGAVALMTKAVALECGQDRIHVNSVHPGFVDTSLIDPVRKADGDNSIHGAHPWGRMGTPSDIAKVVLFLAGEGASFVTGAGWSVDGGFVAR
jgi:NAD(P)-dependent dehydrogenase (short-subunit alcohol dehydrogenase family)